VSTFSLPQDRNDGPSSDGISHGVAIAHGGTAAKNDGDVEKGNTSGHQTSVPQPSLHISTTGPILPLAIASDTSESDATAVTPSSRSVRRTLVIRDEGESGRQGFHPFKFLRTMFTAQSRVATLCNFLWPVVPAAIVLQCKYILLFYYPITHSLTVAARQMWTSINRSCRLFYLTLPSYLAPTSLASPGRSWLVNCRTFLVS
jgi:hypothetical protein